MCACAGGHRQDFLGHQAGAERVIRGIMWGGSQSIDSGSKAVGSKSQICHVLIVTLGNLLNLSSLHFPICKMETIVAPTSEGCWEGLMSSCPRAA